ncbi:MAG: lectin like domain-containing protein [Lachnospiraceae bacterium]|nr:lectin like domain-containing protein [Lachnospiraceae bacterium]
MNKRKSGILCLAALVLGAGTCAETAGLPGKDEVGQEEKTQTEEKRPEMYGFPWIESRRSENGSDPLESFIKHMPDQQYGDARGQALAPVFAAQWDGYLPESWYAGDLGKKPVVRDQGKFGTCWALTAASAMEAVLLPEEQIEFSADHISLSNAFDADVNAGGDYIMLMAYLSGWQGPVTEAEDPYGDGYSPQGLSPAVHVQEVQILEDPDVSQLKKALFRYGAVQTSLYMDKSTTEPGSPYYNDGTDAYYYFGDKIQNHDILILGWDDGYSRFNFREVPARDGAFICQNTWGDDFGEDGIFYVSYEDANIGAVSVLYSRIDPADNYSRIYQADDCGWQGNQGYDDDTCWFANVYTARAEEERLAAVGLYATAPGASCEIYAVTDFEDKASFERRKYLQSAEMENIGYYTIDLEEPVELEAGEQFALVVKMTTPGVWNPVAVEYRADEYTQNVTLEGKEGYLSQTGEYWQNTEEEFGTNVCLKGYTR